MIAQNISIIALSMLKIFGRKKLELELEALMIMLEVPQKTMTTSMMVIIMELGTMKEKQFLSFEQL